MLKRLPIDQGLALLATFSAGDEVQIKNVNFANHAKYIGCFGTVIKTVKKYREVVIRLDDNSTFGSFVENVARV